MSSKDPVLAAIDTILDRIRILEDNQRAELAGAVASVLFVNLPAAGKKGRAFFVSNGRKTGEGAGLGTGVLAYDDGTAWRRVDDGTTVAV